MDSRPPPDPLARLDARARPRVRLGVGAAVVLLMLALVAAVLVSVFAAAPTARLVVPATSPASSLASEASTASPAPGTIFVHVLGAVRRSGLFEVRAGARVMDVVAAAGGLTAKADQTGINLARVVRDGEQVYVPAVGESRAPPLAPDRGAGPGGAPAEGSSGTAAGSADAVVNLNTATAAELETLPRIGPAMAQRIIDYRTANGPFASVDDLRNITGIGDKTFEGLVGRVTV